MLSVHSIDAKAVTDDIRTCTVAMKRSHSALPTIGFIVAISMANAHSRLLCLDLAYAPNILENSVAIETITRQHMMLCMRQHHCKDGH